MDKLQLLHQWAKGLQKAVLDGKFGKNRQQLAVAYVPGPRVGGLDIMAFDDPAGFKKALNEQGGLNLAATVPWTFVDGHPNIFSHGKVIRVEAPWPAALAETNIPLRAIRTVQHQHFVAGWIAGNDENGRLVVPNFILESHWLIAGQTGGGKSVALTSAIGQLMQVSGGKTHFVLVDGKHGESLSALAHAPFLAGPPAYDMESAQLALTWTVAEMGKRYQTLRELSSSRQERWLRETPRLVVVIDEVQTISQKPELAAMIALLLQQGRACKINLMISTQYPLNAIMGDSSMKQNLGGRIILKMNSFDASRVAIGGSEPDATKLLGKGDAYIIAGGSFVRTQIAYLNRRELGQISGAAPLIDSWPEIEISQPSASGGMFSAKALALSILAASRKIGRPSFKKQLDDAGEGRMGMQKLYSLLNFGREVWSFLQDYDLNNCTALSEEDPGS